jgi:hypothetical protein
MLTADKLRRVVLSLPEAEERETWGHPTFRVRDKMFATLSDDGRQATVKATREEQAALVAAAPETFSIPAYVGKHGWVGVQLATVDPVELAELLVEAWRHTAPNAWSRPTTLPNRPTDRGRAPSAGSGVGSAGRVTGGRGSMRAWLLDPVRFR